MKKKISVLLCMLLAMLVLASGCGAAKETVEYDEAYLQELTEFMITYCDAVDEATLEQIQTLRESVVEDQLVEMGLPVEREEFISAIEAWQAGVSECGTYVQHGEFTYEAGNDEVIVSAQAEFADRSAIVEFAYDENLYLETVTVSAQYSTGEILQKAGLNTLLGMGTVFVVLIIISGIISMLKYIPAIQEKFKKGSKAEEVQAKEEMANVQPQAPETDDAELIAVIAAAIAAAEGTTTDGFVVRSIKRRTSNKWR